MKFKGFIGEAYNMPSLPISAQRCINWYTEKIDNEHGGTFVALQPTPGYKELIDLDDGSLPHGSFNRGMIRTSKGLGTTPEDDGSVIVVIGPRVIWYKPASNTYEVLGEISTAISRVSMVDDGTNLIIAEGTGLYKLELQSKLLTRISFDLTEPTSVAYMDNRVISVGTRAGLPQNTFFWSNLNDSASWDALSYAQAGFSQDPITGLITAGNFLYLFGPSSYELWTSNNDQDLPFVRSYGSSGTVGLYAKNSLTKIGSSVFFLGSTNQGSVGAFMSNGTDMVRVSTIALDSEWSNFNVSDCTTWTRSQYGHDFVYFNFDAMDKTYVFDVRQGSWHQAASRDENTDTLHRWTPNNNVQFGNKAIVGDRFSTKLFDLSNDHTTEDGQNILRIRTTAHVNAEQKLMHFEAVRFDMETGNGITIEDPSRHTQPSTIMFRYSHDRGRVWSSTMRKSMGATGNYSVTPEFRRLGVARNLTVEFSISDATHTSILNGWLYAKVAQRGRR